MPLTRLRRRRVEGRKGRCGARHSHLLRVVSMDGSRNAYAERFVRTIKESCLERMIFFGEDSLRNATHNFVAHYHTERNHQGLGNRLIVPIQSIAENTGIVRRRQRLDGMLNYYDRNAA